MFSWSNSTPVQEKVEQLQAAGMNGGWRQLKQDIVKYNELRDEIIDQMEKKEDPVYKRYLQLYKESLTPEEYAKNRLRIYAICNQRAMQECLSVDEMVEAESRSTLETPQVPTLSSAPEDLSMRQEPMN